MLRLTQSQIEQKIQQLKAQGVDESFINRKLQTEISSGNISVSAEPNIVSKVGGAIVKPAVDFGKYLGEAGVGVSRLLSDPNYRNAVLKSNQGKELSPEEAQAVLSKPTTQFLSEDKVKDRGTIVSTGAKATAGAASYAIPFGTSAKALAGAGAVSGALGAYSQDESVTQGALLGAGGSLVLGKLAPKLFGKGASKVAGDTRPVHQALLEKAANVGDTAKINTILDSIPASDPYKKPMETLFRGGEKATEKYTKMTVPEQLFHSNFTIPRPMSKYLKPRETVKTMLEYKNVGSIEDIGNFASRVSGESGFVTKLQRKAISQSGKNIPTGNIYDGVGKSLDQVIDITPAQKKQIISNIQNSLPVGENIGSANALDAFDAIQKLEKTGYQYLKKGTNNFTGNIRDEEIGKIYLNVAENLKDSLEIGAKNQTAIKSIITPEVLAEANKISPKLAEKLSSANTIKDLRAIQAPFVRIQKMIDTTLESESSVFGKVGKGMQMGKLPLVGGAIELGTNALGGSTNITTRIASGIKNIGEGAKASTGKFSFPTSPAGARVGMVTAPAVGEQMLSGTPSEAITPTQKQGAVDIFGGHSKQEVLNAALQSGAKLKDLKEISDTYDLLSEASGGGKSNIGKVSAQNYSNASTGSQSLKTVESLLFNSDGSLNRSVSIALKTPGRPNETARLAAAHLYNIADAYLRLRTGAIANPSEIQKLADNLEPGITDSVKVVKEKLKVYKNVFDTITNLSSTQGIGDDTQTLESLGIMQ